MKFKYRNLSKSLLCVLFPVLVGCGAKNDKSAKVSCPDSITVMYNKASMAEKCYDDLVDIVITIENYEPSHDNPKMRAILEKYQEAKMAQLVDSQLYYDDMAIVAERKNYAAAHAYKNCGAYDSICAAYDRMIVAERCYLDLFEKLRIDYDTVTQHLGGPDEILLGYQVQKMFRLSDSLMYFRAEQARLLHQKDMLKRTK